MVDSLFFIALVAAAAMPPDNGAQAPAGQAARQTSLLKQTVAGIWKDAAIDGDSEYQKLIAGDKVTAIAPLDLRRIYSDWPEPRLVYRSPRKVSISFGNEYVTSWWYGEITCGEEQKAVEQRVVAALEKQGYRPLEATQWAALDQRFKAPIGHKRDVYRRTIGDTEVLVSFVANSRMGSSTYNSEVNFTWLARRTYRRTATLADALAALPPWVKVDFLDDKFFAALGDEPVTSLESGGGWGITIEFAQPIADKLIEPLENSGFEKVNDKQRMDGSTWQIWYRFTDVTYAHITTNADGKGLRINCKPPRHTGEPITVRPPHLHPIARLPLEKRPVLSFDQLPFEHANLQQHAKLFHNLAEKLAGPDWHVQLYKDVRKSAKPFYVAQWQSSAVGYSAVGDRARPYQSMSLVVKDSHVDGADRLTGLAVVGAAIPLEGWAVQVRYEVWVAPDGALSASLDVEAGLARKGQDYWFSGSRAVGPPALLERSMSVEVKETKDVDYELRALLAPDDFARRIRMFYGTPETLRDEVLLDIAALRKRSLDQVDRGEVMKYTELPSKGGEPPMHVHEFGQPLNEAIERAILDKVEAELAAREENVREHFGALHAALQQALPLAKVLDELPAPSAPEQKK